MRLFHLFARRTKVARGKALLADLDLHVLSDFYDKGQDCTICGGTNAIVDDEPCGNPEHYRTCFYIGWPEELGAGLRGGHIDTPLFTTENEAYIWAVDHPSALAEV